MSIGRIVRAVISIVITAIVGLVINYFALPAMTWQSVGFWWFWIVLLVVAAIVYVATAAIFDDLYDAPVFSLITAGGAVIMVIALIITAISGSAMVNPYDYQKIASVEDGVFAEDVLEATSEDMIIVDVKTAEKLGHTQLGKLKNSTWYEVDGEYNLISINGEEYRISPINYGGLFKYNKACEEGITAYVLVNAKTQDSELVMLDEPMKYSPSAFWSYDLTRHIHNEFPTYILDKSFFEVDDDGNPYWITGVKTATIGMRGGQVITSAIITNAVTGENIEYSIEEIPEWVDHVFSVSYLMEIASWHYSLTEGYFNFSNTNVFRTSYYYKDSNSESSSDNPANEFTPFEGYNSIIAKDGRVWFYTGITPANNAETNKGFLLISPRTGEMKFYEVSGAEESSAQIAAEGLVSNMNYSASFPTVVNIEGEETYFMTLKDGGGLVQRYAFCNVKNYAKCVCASSIDEAIKLYKIMMGFESAEDDKNITSTDQEKDNNTDNQEVHEYKEATGVVTSVDEAQLGGYTYYYFMIEGESKIFMSSIENSNMQPVRLTEGALVNITYYDSKEEGIGIVTKITFEEF